MILESFTDALRRALRNGGGYVFRLHASAGFQVTGINQPVPIEFYPDVADFLIEDWICVDSQEDSIGVYCGRCDDHDTQCDHPGLDLGLPSFLKVPFNRAFER